MSMSALANLSPEQRLQLEQRLLHKAVKPCVVSSPNRKASGIYPLSHAQESLWFIYQLDPASCLYNVYEAIRLAGPLNCAALEAAFDSVVRRHDAFRTSFSNFDGSPAQVISEHSQFSLKSVDLTELEENQREEQILKLVEAEIRKPFDLSKDCLLRACLFKISGTDHILTLCTHHIVSDLHSFVILHDEISRYYNHLCAGTAIELPPVKLQFPEYASCQRERFSSSIAAENLAWWKKQFSGDLPVLNLPTDRPRAAQKTFAGGKLNLNFDRGLSESIKELSKSEGLTTYQLLLTVFNAVLHRYTGQSSMTIGCPISERNRTEIEGTIGYFINTLPLKLHISPGTTFRSALKNTREALLDALAHQEFVVDRLVEELQTDRIPGRNPLFQAVFQFLPGATIPLKLTGLSTNHIDVGTGTAKFELNLTLADDSKGLTGNIEYSADLFDETTIRRMMTHFKVLLRSAVTNPESPIGKLEMLPDYEKQTVLIDWNRTTAELGKEPIHRYFEARATERPEAVALKFEGSQITYGELNQRANRVAACLIRSGVKKGEFVGFCIDRSFEMIVGLLGVLKAGGAYVTFDPAYPQERLSYMFGDTNVQVFLTTSKHKHLAPESVKCICLDELQDPLGQTLLENPSIPVCINDPAYVIYTSGSTGLPKAVVVPHRGIVRLVKGANYLKLTAQDVFLQFAPISFDASTLEIWGPLANGGQLVIFPPNFVSLEQLGETIWRHEITTLWLTAGLFHQMIEHHIGSLVNVKYLLAGGDVLSPAHVKKALSELPQTTIINGYGPTENTTFTCCYTVPRTWSGEQSIPIGTPISNTQAYILDSEMQPCPIGVFGELYVGGDGLAAGYLNAPELTSSKFLPNPFSDRPGEKLYRTGDLVRWLPDGNIEFAGRLDTQVKIRGYRVEPGEIETVLQQYPGIAHCAVAARKGQDGTKSLIAYVVSKPGCSVDEKLLRSELAKHLPPHMVPARVMVTNELPLNANGKVDRKRLAELSEAAQNTRSRTAPQNPTEAKLYDIWSELLNRNDMSIEDNFFELGGHSLLATRLISRINNAFKVTISLKTLFDAPSISMLAKRLASSPSPDSNTTNTPIIRRPRRTNVTSATVTLSS